MELPYYIPFLFAPICSTKVSVHRHVPIWFMCCLSCKELFVLSPTIELNRKITSTFHVLLLVAEHS